MGVPLYDELAGYYDIMVSWKGRFSLEAPFLERVFREKKAHRVLDVASGTGMHAILFAGWGYEVIGSDLSAEMVAVARENASRSNAHVSFVQADFTELVQKVQGRFDVITCLGNSLPHILTTEDLATTLDGFFSLLNPGGILITQNRNYDKICRDQDRFNPPNTVTKEDTEYIFFRFYDFLGDMLQFNIATFEKRDGKWGCRINSTKQKPVFKGELNDKLKDAGFNDISFLGSFSGSDFDVGGSPDLIAMATKE